MELQTLVMLTLGTFVVVGLASSMVRPGPREQVIYIVADPVTPQGSGCLPLMLLVGAILAAVIFLG